MFPFDFSPDKMVSARIVLPDPDPPLISREYVSRDRNSDSSAGRRTGVSSQTSSFAFLRIGSLLRLGCIYQNFAAQVAANGFRSGLEDGGPEPATAALGPTCGRATIISCFRP